MRLTDEEIKKVTDKAKTWCLVGHTRFEEDVQQFTCRFMNGINCQCHREYLEAIRIAYPEPNHKVIK